MPVGPPGRLSVVTVLGTRPEIIRLSCVIERLDRTTRHVLVHTGQNRDHELNQVFFDDLGLRPPDHVLGADPASLGTTFADVLVGTERVLRAERPDAVVVLGDTNSAISAVMARRMGVATYHLEAGNRCFDERVPEEVNRRLVDHVADVNLVYTEHARRNLLAEGIHPSRILLIGSPLREVLDRHASAVAASDALARLGLAAGGYLLASLHREENVDDPWRLAELLRALRALGDEQAVPVVVSTHPRTRARLRDQPAELTEGLVLHPPFGFVDYVRLQQAARLVLSDSGSISEEAAILGFPAVTLRDTIERPEALDAGSIVCSGVAAAAVLDAARIVLDSTARGERAHPPAEYAIADTSRRVVHAIRSTVHSVRHRPPAAADPGSHDQVLAAIGDPMPRHDRYFS